MRHYVITGVLVVVLAIATYAGLMAIKLMPVEASAQSIPIDQLWNIEIAIICFLFALIMVPLIYSLIVFRRKKGIHQMVRTLKEITPSKSLGLLFL